MAQRRALTQLQVDNWKAEDDRVEVPDPGQPGLYLVVHPTGKKSWVVRYRRLSDRASRKFTIDGFCSAGTARQKARDALRLVAEGKDPAAEKQEAKRLSMSSM